MSNFRCIQCDEPVIRGVFGNNEYKDIDEFMKKVQEEYILVGLVTIPVATLYCTKNHAITLLGESK